MNDLDKINNEINQEIQKITLSDVLNLDELQRLQDLFSNAHGVASIITDIDGTPFTQPSNFTHLCDIIRDTEKGCANCYKSDAVIGRFNPTGPNVQTCLSGGLWDAGSSISVGGVHVANWLIGQIRNDQVDEKSMMEYAHEVGADKVAFKAALKDVPVVSEEQFTKIADLLFVFVDQLSNKAFNNMQLKKQIEENKKMNALLLEREENLKQERILLRTIIDSIPDAIYVKDLEYRKVIANKTDCQNCGFENEEDVIGKTDFDMFPYEIAKNFLADEEPVIEDGRSLINIEEYIKRPNFDEKFILTSKLPLYDDKGKIIGLVGIGHDITDRKEAEILLKEKNNEIATHNEALEQSNVELKKAKEKAEESDRLKSSFLANMSHEIRTPMNGILGFAELLKEPDLNSENQQEYIEIIEKSGVRMLNIINDIIDISKIESGLMKLDVKESNINEQIDYIYTFFKPEAEAKGMKFYYKKALPAKEAIIKTDKEKVYAILINLVKNALKYAEKGSIELGYETEDRHGSSFIRFYVKDTGVGIPKDRQKAIFDRFIQVDNANKRSHQGAGLGLAITKAYVEMLDGELWVESEENKGSTFYFTLPYNPESDAEADDRILPSYEKSTVDRKLKILIAEDDEVSEILLHETVRPFGNEILKVRTGVEAVEICQGKPDIDLILMDIGMPEMDGYEATRQIREFNKDVVIIAQTAYGLASDRKKAIEAGCNNYMAKPIKKAELLGLIKKYFGK